MQHHGEDCYFWVDTCNPKNLLGSLGLGQWSPAVKHDPQYLNTYVQALGWRNGAGRGEGWLLPGVRVAPRVVVGEHACQVNHGDLCSLLLHDPPNLAASYSFLLSLVSLASPTLDFHWLHFFQCALSSVSVNHNVNLCRHHPLQCVN